MRAPLYSIRPGILVLFLISFGVGSRAIGKPNALEILVLDSGGPRALGRAATGYAILVDEIPRILVDAGPGAFVQISRLRLDLTQLDTVLLTHLHIDHNADLPAVILARSLSSKSPIKFKIFGPNGGPGFQVRRAFFVFFSIKVAHSNTRRRLA